MAAYILFFGWLASRTQSWDQNVNIPLPAWIGTVGVFFGAVGALIAFACAGMFVTSGRGTPAILDPPREFVATGPYKFVRNPMYDRRINIADGIRSLSALARNSAFYSRDVCLVSFVRRLRRRAGTRSAVWQKLFCLQAISESLDPEVLAQHPRAES